MDKKRYQSLKLRVFHTSSQDVLCESTDGYTTDVYADDGWQDATCQ